MRPHRRQPTGLRHPWDSPGKNTGGGCHFLLQCVKVKLVSCVRLFVTPWTAAHQASLSMEFYRQEYWSGLPFTYPFVASVQFSSVAQSCPTLRDSTDCSLPGSSVRGIFQVRVLEWGAIAFSGSTFWNNLNGEKFQKRISSIQFSRSVVSDSLQPMNRSMPGLPVHHQIPEFTQTHVH